MSIVHAADFAEIDVLVVQLLRELIDRFVAALPDGLVHLHLQHEVAAALEVKPKLDAVGEVLLHLRERSGKLRQCRSGRKCTDKDDDGDKNEFPLELRTHVTGLTLFLFGLKSGDGAARHLDLHLLGDAELHGIGFEARRSCHRCRHW